MAPEGATFRSFFDQLAHQIRFVFHFGALALWQVPVQPLVDQPKEKDDHQGQQDEIESEDRVGDKGVEGLIRKVFCIVERISLLSPGWETRNKSLRRR